MDQSFLDALRRILPAEAILTNPAERLVYECDAYTAEKSMPDVVLLPSSTEEIASIVKTCRAFGVPFLARGAGTGLSGGATALEDTVIISIVRMNRILGLDVPNRRARVQAGVINGKVTEAAAPFGLQYAPDPGSQAVSTIAGNIAENAGGPHTLRSGVTTNHVISVQCVTPEGDVVELGGEVEDAPGLDLVGITCGAEGTFNIITEATVRLIPAPQAWRTLLAVFDTVDDATNTVTEIIAGGIVPAALEMIDSTIIQSVEAAFRLGFPLDCAAVLLIELDGPEAGLDRQERNCRVICERNRARRVENARSPEDREALWKARKKGVGTLGRITRSMVTQDCVIPRSRLPEVMRQATEIVARHGLRVANIFHAGDGNLHPIVLFDERNPDEVRRMESANHEIVELCLGVGGSLTGEHGIGVEKQDFMAMMYSEADLDMMLRVHSALDPDGLCNPGKVFPGLRRRVAEETARGRRVRAM